MQKLVRKNYATYNMRQKYALYDIERIGYFDIECTNLHPEFGNVLSIVLLVRDVSGHDKVIATKVFKITKEEVDKSLRTGEIDFDKRVIEEFFKALKTYKINLLIGHYSNGWGKMDMPFLRSRALIMGIEDCLPGHREIRFGDTWRLSHTALKSHSYRLDAVGIVTNAKGHKTRIAEKMWQLAKYGIKKGLDYVVDHNIKDVKLTYQVHKKVERFNPIPATYV